MDAGKTQMNDMMKMMQVNTKSMEQSVNSHLGGNIDIRL